MELSHRTISLKLRHTFRTSRESSEQRHNVICQVQHQGIVGLGEAAPSAYYGQDAHTVSITLSALSDQLGNDPFALDAVTREMTRRFPEQPAARAAVDMALHDIVGKTVDMPLYRLLGLDPQRMPQTSMTVGIDSIEQMQQRVRELDGMPIIKVKLGTPQDEQIVRAVRQASRAIIRVDANGAWRAKEALEKISRLSEYGIEFVEQPLAAEDREGLRWLKKRVDIPIILDESVRTARDIPGLSDCAHGINIKLMKCGGLREALRMIHVARAHDLRVMLGCMVETSLAITAAAHISPLADYIDLDGNLLIEGDPFVGARTVEGRLTLPEEPGIGIAEVSEQGGQR